MFYISLFYSRQNKLATIRNAKKKAIPEGLPSHRARLYDWKPKSVDQKDPPGVPYHEFQSEQIPTDAELAYGDPATEIVKWVEKKGCDLVAMSTHGHRLLADIFLGTTASRVQHKISIPVLLLRAK